MPLRKEDVNREIKVESNKEENEEIFEIIEVPTETKEMVRNNNTGEELGILELLVKIANDIERIKKGIM